MIDRAAIVKSVKLLLIDNYDSFVYNLAQAFGALGADPLVLRSDTPLAELVAENPDAVVISPGPGSPADAGVSVEAIKEFAGRVPLLGVCLGHQCIGAAFGAHVGPAQVGPMHGKTSPIEHDGAGVFAGLPNPFEATRYHSLAIADDDWPEELDVTARASDGVVMGVRHRRLAVEGVQFHPESILTPAGVQLLGNFLS